jgi:hypothetical protein
MTGTTRGLNRDNLRPPAGAVAPPRCAALAVGSLPYRDAAEAIRLIFEQTPVIPAWPQLPRRSFLESMYVQFTEGMPGLLVDRDNERVTAEADPRTEEISEFLEKIEQNDPDLFPISDAYAAGLTAFRAALSERTECDGPPAFVKGQVTGPVSFGLTILQSDGRPLLFNDTLREIATAVLAMKGRWQERRLREWAPSSLPVIFIDEPYLAQLGSAYVNVPPDLSYPLLEECLRPLACLRGIHVCGGTDWAPVLALPVDLLSFDAADHLDSIVTQRETVAAFVSEGGVLAWGAVPNDERALKLDAEAVGRRVLQGAEALERTGIVSTDDTLAFSFVSPACGTGALAPHIAEHCFRLTGQASDWLRNRLS